MLQGRAYAGFMARFGRSWGVGRRPRINRVGRAPAPFYRPVLCVWGGAARSRPQRERGRRAGGAKRRLNL